MTASHSVFRLLIAFLTIAVNAPLHAQSGTLGKEEDSAWREVLQAQDDAKSLQEKEVQNPKEYHLKRTQAFAVAADKSAEFATKYSPAGELKRLRLTYRVAIDLELAEEYTQALKALMQCQDHPQYHSNEAIYDGKRIDVLVPERINAIGDLIKVLTMPPTTFPGSPGFGGGRFGSVFTSGHFLHKPTEEECSSLIPLYRLNHIGYPVECIHSNGHGPKVFNSNVDKLIH